MKRFLVVAVLALATLAPATSFAVQPDEVLADPVLEARARNLSTGLRCLVCQNQSIDESDAPLARDLRIMIREQLTANKTDAEIMSFVVDRYGDYVLLKPRFNSRTLVLWAVPFVALFGGFIFMFRRRNAQSPREQALSTEEQARLKAILQEDT